MGTGRRILAWEGQPFWLCGPALGNSIIIAAKNAMPGFERTDGPLTTSAIARCNFRLYFANGRNQQSDRIAKRTQLLQCSRSAGKGGQSSARWNATQPLMRVSLGGSPKARE